MLAKLLGPHSVVLSLNLCDNMITSDGGRYLGRALRGNESLVDLNLRLNRLADEGGAMVMEGLRSNATLESLNLGSNSLGELSVAGLCRLLRMHTSGLRTVDLSGNDVGEEEASLLAEAVAGYSRVMSLDLRMNKVPLTSEHVKAIRDRVKRNELRERDYRAK